MKTSNFSRNQVSDVRFLVDEAVFTGENWLISVSDTDAKHVGILLPMEKVLYIKFNDIALPFDGSITDEHAATIATFIRQAKAAKANLWVNCHAGVSRSGAIVELLSHLGWTIDEDIRSRRRVPNALVHSKIRKHFPEYDIPELRPIVEYLEQDHQVIYP